jgi:hypothetical protein
VLPALGSLFGAAGGGFSASAGPSTSGNNDAGDNGSTVGGINTGTQSVLPEWAMLAGVAILALWILKRR